MKIFIAGPRVINELNIDILSKLNSICKNAYEILIGDATGIDSAIQRYLSNINYKKVSVYSSNGIVRNNIGNWETVSVPVKPNTKGFEFYVQKDIQMAKNADAGLMIWNGESRGTFNDIINLLDLNKTVLMYLTSTQKFYTFTTRLDFERFLGSNIKLSNKLKKILERGYIKDFKQVCLFESKIIN